MPFNFSQISKQQSRILKYLGFLLLVYFALFYKLGSNPIEIWDESLFSLRALHLYETGSYLVNFDNYAYLPDHRNTKLPFTTFFQVLGYKLFGVNELGLRVPIVSIFLLTMLYVIKHFRSVHSSENGGFIFGLILITSTGLFGPHMARSGDHDVAFGCYLLLSTIFFGNYLHQGKSKSLILFTAAFIAAIMTKNLLAGLIFPGVFIYTLMSKNLVKCLKDYRIYLSVLCIAIIYCGSLWYFEWKYNGFISRMWGYELMGRYKSTIENHGGTATYYFNELIRKFSPYYLMVIVSIALTLHKFLSSTIKQRILLASSVFLSYIFIISMSETKTFWYLAPCYIFGAYIVALGSLGMLEIITIKYDKRFSIATTILLIALFLKLYVPIVDNNANPSRALHKDEKYGIFIEQILSKPEQIKEFTIIDNNFGSAAFFYKKKFEYENPNITITYQRSTDVEIGTTVVTCLQNVLNPLSDKYEYEVIDRWSDCKFLKILSKKSHELN